MVTRKKAQRTVKELWDDLAKAVIADDVVFDAAERWETITWALDMRRQAKGDENGT